MPKEFDNCVRKVKTKSGTRNPYAVCRGALGSDAKIKARRKRRKRKAA